MEEAATIPRPRVLERASLRQAVSVRLMLWIRLR